MSCLSGYSAGTSKSNLALLLEIPAQNYFLPYKAYKLRRSNALCPDRIRLSFLPLHSNPHTPDRQDRRPQFYFPLQKFPEYLQNRFLPRPRQKFHLPKSHIRALYNHFLQSLSAKKRNQDPARTHETFPLVPFHLPLCALPQ